MKRDSRALTVRNRSGLGAALERTWYGVGAEKGEGDKCRNAERAGSERKTRSVGSVGKCRKV